MSFHSIVLLLCHSTIFKKLCKSLIFALGICKLPLRLAAPPVMRPLFYRCHNTTSVEKGNSATMGGVLFSTGLVGNLLALGLLARSGLGSCPPRSPRPPPSVFYVLVFGLTITDLLGKCLVSPFVLFAYCGGWCPDRTALCAKPSPSSCPSSGSPRRCSCWQWPWSAGSPWGTPSSIDGTSPRAGAQWWRR